MQVLLLDIQFQYLVIYERDRVPLSVTWLQLMKLLRELFCIPELMRQDQQAEGDEDAKESKHTADVRPDIYGLIVARDKALADAAYRVVIDAIAT